MDGLIGIYKNLVNILKRVEELRFIPLKNEGYRLEIINDIERKILNHLKIREVKDMASFGIIDSAKIWQMNNFLSIIVYYVQ